MVYVAFVKPFLGRETHCLYSGNCVRELQWLVAYNVFLRAAFYLFRDVLAVWQLMIRNQKLGCVPPWPRPDREETPGPPSSPRDARSRLARPDRT